MNLKSKLIWTYCLITTIPLLLLASFMVGRMTKEAQRDTVSYAIQSSSQVGDAMDVYVDIFRELMDYLILSMESEASLPSARELMIRRHESIISTYPEIVGIAVADEDDTFIGTGMNRISRDYLGDEEWFLKAPERGKGISILNSSEGKIVITNEAYSADQLFSIMGTGMINGKKTVILMDIKKDVLKSLIESVSVSPDSFVFILDQNGDIVYTPVNPVVYWLDEKSLSIGDGQQDNISIDGNNYLISVSEGKLTNWKFISVTSLKEQEQNVLRMYVISFVSAILALILVVLISMALAESFNKPIKQLKDKMQLVEQGDLSVRANLEYENEIGTLGKNFDHMLDYMNTLVEDIQTEKQRTLQARLKSLQEQIKPHFLYNTLDTINWMAREHGATDVVRMVEALTNMFRLGLSQGKDFITVKEEIEHVKNYLYIQSVRYEDKLTYVIDASEDCLKIVIPKLILQPLVENAIYHGIKLKKGGGEIRISAKKENGQLILSVYDTGAGMSREELNSLRQSIEDIKNGKSGSFGMTYVIERLKLYANEGFDIEVESYEGAYTQVIVRLLIKED
ncbi:sensor histidine kinase [Butyrivibrio sp. AE2032]|uniref:sensor histidine kinase n=1 Tax=Butyrivibrio sp. AE2032 TaxID=1458463 RepID=UPI00163B553E|nr:histidine kinase [Butyrivibrio sp. AE2032]